MPGLRLTLALILWSAASFVSSAEWQFVLRTDPSGQMAYLWIPPSCRHVRGVIWGEKNMLEDTAFRSPIIREAAEKASLAIIWTIPKNFRWFRYDQGAGDKLERILAAFADKTGYSELKYAPILPLGHSAASPFAWYVAAWKPQRTIALISLKGGVFPRPDFDPKATIEGVPSLAITGEYYEWPEAWKSRHARWRRDQEVVLRMRKASDKNLVSLLVDVSRGHFDWTDDLARLVALYITKAAQHRLPAQPPLDGPVTLNPIAPESGWLMEPNAVERKPPVMAAYRDYSGSASGALWYFDQEMAQAVARYGDDQKGKLYQMVGFVQDGNRLPVADKGYSSLKFQPLADDPTSFKLQGYYLDRTPPELPNQAPLRGHSSTPLKFVCMTGPVVRTGPETFRLVYDFRYPAFPTDVQLLVYSEGDEKYRMAYQPGIVHVESNREGKKQRIVFAKIDNQPRNVKSISLDATSDCGLPIQFYVKYGPAHVEGNRLILDAIPPRSRFPVEVAVVANQWGSPKEPKIQTATPVERAFFIEDVPTVEHH